MSSTALPPVTGRTFPTGVAVAGGALTTLAVLAGGRIGPPGDARTFTTWFGLWRPVALDPATDRLPGLLLAVALLGLAVLWVGTVGRARRGTLSAGQLWRLGAVWVTPLAVGPPLLSNDAYSYVAQGAIARFGADPTFVPAVYLGPRSLLLHAVDPRWRGTPSPYGPLAGIVERLAAGVGVDRPVLSVLALRGLAVAAVLAIALVTTALRRATAGDDPREAATTLALTWLNPVLLLQVVSAAHLEGLIAALTVLALLLACRSGVRSWGWLAACALAGAVAAVKLPVGVLLLAALVVTAAAQAAADRRALLRVALGPVSALAAWGVLAVVAGGGWHVLATLTTPAEGRTVVAPATLTADLLTPLRWLGLVGASDLDLVGRALWAAAGVAAVTLLLVTARRRSLVDTAGGCLLVAAFAAPVLYPWYLLWGLVPLAAVVRGRALDRLVLLTAVGAVMTIQGLTRGETIAVTTVVVVAVAARVWHTEPAVRRLVSAVRARRSADAPAEHAELAG